MGQLLLFNYLVVIVLTLRQAIEELIAVWVQREDLLANSETVSSHLLGNFVELLVLQWICISVQERTTDLIDPH